MLLTRPLCLRLIKSPLLASRPASTFKMGKKSKVVPESHFRLVHPAISESSSPIVDTHTHLASTFEAYRHKYPAGDYTTVFDFVRGLYVPAGVQQIVDVWCEAPVRPLWREFADSALTEDDRQKLWGGVGYWFVMGVHPHEARLYTDAVEADIIDAMAHPRCVGWGEMGLDYHYDNSPRPVQQEVFTRQLRCAVRLNKPLTIHTREADEDTERILKEVVPKEHRIHIHCFTDSPAFAQRLLDWFPNLYIGITGVITYTTNIDTSTTVRNMFSPPTSSSSSSDTDTSTTLSQAVANVSLSPPQDATSEDNKLRILLETDAPYMVPAPIYTLPGLVGKKLPLCHSGMVPWTAGFVAALLPQSPKLPSAGEADGAKNGEVEAETNDGEGKNEGGWDAARVMRVARENARAVYGV
ncbi:hydrolase [Mycena alexandri]|uniref:Hydrolase n=1 Tax=Mycena alexandri TaxID=1745969 RepID=A0AAD6XA70_9AGAR|nr:hydrolase [Mycena alexandri]